MNQLKITYEDREYEFLGYNTSKGTHFLTNDGYLFPRTMREPVKGVAYFHLVPVRHTFGGIVWEETGEERVGMLKGQCGILIQSGDVVIATHEIKVTHNSKYRILRRVEVTDAEDD